MPTGATVAALDDLAAGDARRRAQLGLPLHLDARLDASRCRRCTSSTSTGRPTSSCSSSPTSSRTRTASLQIMYGIDGRRDLTESTLDDLSGYDGARPVRIGNGAFDQRQNDVFGAVLDSILLHTRRSQRLPRRLWPIVRGAGRVRDEGLAQPDQGIWEARGEPQHYVSSKLMCWVALDRAAQLAGIRGDDGAAADAGGRRPRRSTPTSSSTASASGASCASTTTPTRSTPRRCWSALFGFLPGDDERLRATRAGDRRRADRARLRPALPHRRDRRRPRRGKEGTFLICSFWLVSALRDDRRAAARPRPVERLLRIASPLGPLRRGVRRRRPAATSATSRRPSPTSR